MTRTCLNGTPLSAREIVQLAGSPSEIEVTTDDAMRRSADYAAAVSAQRPVYGRSTGVGANRLLPAGDEEAVAHALLRSHATSAGPVRSPARIRAMLVVRLNQLAAGGSGVRPELVAALAAMLRADALPPVLEEGGIGTGDLSALARTALALMGELPTEAPLPMTFRFSAQDALPFLSSNAASIADSALACDELSGLARAGLRVAALTFRAVDGNLEAFSLPVERVTPFPGARAVCRAMRSLLIDVDPPARIQDPYGLRTLPQAHGAYLDRLAELDACVAAFSAAPAENPVFLPDVGVAHHGGFHAVHLAQALDAARSAAAQSAELSGARLAMLMQPAITGLPPFLADTQGRSGAMVSEYVGAAARARLIALAAPAAVQTAVVSLGVEEDASFAALAARQAMDCAPSYRTVLAVELVAAVRALRMKGRAVPAPLGSLSPAMEDRDLTADIAVAESVLETLAVEPPPDQ